MAIVETFSRRRDKAANAGKPEVYVYDKLPDSLVNQIIMILDEVLPEDSYSFKIMGNYTSRKMVWEALESTFKKEHGIRAFPREYGRTPEERLKAHFYDTSNNDHRLNFIDLAFRIIGKTNLKAAPGAIDELNKRFKLAGVGYQFVEGKLIRLDSTVAHEEMVKPALVLLGRQGFEKADEEYRLAHEHYRHGKHADAITSAGRAFEATLKAICTQKGWAFNEGDRASDLVKVVVKNGLLPDWLDNGITAYVAMMKTGLPTVRNNAGGHGSAPDAAPVQEHLARYALHMSAANILFVAEAAQSKQRKPPIHG